MVAAQPDRVIGQCKVQAVLRRIDDRLYRFDGKADDVLQQQLFVPQRDLALLDARDIEQILDQPGHVAEAAVHRAADFGNRVGAFAPLEQPQPRDQRHDRVAQLVREHREKAVFLCVGHLQFEPHRSKAVALLCDLAPLIVELKEDVGLGAQDIGLNRLLDEVDRARLIAAEPPRGVAAAGGDEDDRHMARTLAAAHQLGQLEPVHARHLHVEQRQRIVVDQQQFERLFAARCLVALQTIGFEQRFERDKIFRQVVDQQAFDGIVAGVHAAAQSRNWRTIWAKCIA